MGYYTFFLPKPWLRAAITGWKTAEVTRKEVPDQKAWIAVPCSFWVMMGSAILRDVASRAAASVMIQREVKASISGLPALNSGVTFSRGGSTTGVLSREEDRERVGSAGVGASFSSKVSDESSEWVAIV